MKSAIVSPNNLESGSSNTDHHVYSPVTRTFDAPAPVFCFFIACEISVVAIRTSLDVERHKANLTLLCMTDWTLCFMSSKKVRAKQDECPVSVNKR